MASTRGMGVVVDYFLMGYREGATAAQLDYPNQLAMTDEALRAKADAANGVYRAEWKRTEIREGYVLGYRKTLYHWEHERQHA